MKTINVHACLNKPTKNLDEYNQLFHATNHHDTKTITNVQKTTWEDVQGLSWIFFESVI